MSDSSDGDTTKGWALVNQAGQLEDSDDAGSVSSCDVALNEDVVHFHHTPRRSSSAVSGPLTPTNLDGSVTPRTPTNDGTSAVPANFRERDSLTSSVQENTASNASAQSNVNSLHLPANQLPQGARPKTTNQHPANHAPAGDQSLDQSSSSSNSTITSGDQKCNDPNLEISSSSPNHEDMDAEDDFDEDTMMGVPDEKADTSSMSSIEILNMSADDWQGDEEMSQERGVYPVMQPLLSTSALSTDRDDQNHTQASVHHSSSDTDSDFVRINQSMSQEIPDHEEHQDSVAAAAIQEDIPQDNDYNGLGASALPLDEGPEDRWNDSIHSSASHSGSSFSMCGDARPAMLATPSHGVQDVHHHHLLEEEEEEEDEEPLLAPSQRFHGDQILGRQYFTRRLRRDMSMSVSSSASDLSTFSFLGLRAGRQRINRQHSDDMSESMSSVFTDVSDDLPANMMIGTTKPGPKQYRHKRAERLNSKLNYLVLLVIAFVFALGVGHYVGSYSEKYYKHQIRQGQVKRLRELQDDLITCLDQTTETDDKKTFSDMVKSLLGDNVRDDTMESDGKDHLEKGGEVVSEEENDLGCDQCIRNEYTNKYSEECHTLCVQGSLWAKLDKGISELPMGEEGGHVEGAGDANDVSKVSFTDEEKRVDVNEEENDIDCEKCKEGKNKYSEACNTLCVQGSLRVEREEAISDLPMDKGEEVDVEGAGNANDVSKVSFTDEEKEVDGFDGGFDNCDIRVVDENRGQIMYDELVLQSEVESSQNEKTKNTDDVIFEALLETSDTTNDHIEPVLDDIPGGRGGEDLTFGSDETIVESPEETRYDGVIDQEEETYSYEEAMDLKNTFEKKQDSLEEEEPGFMSEKVIVMPDVGEEEVTVTTTVQKKQDDLMEEEPGFIAEKVIVMPQGDEEKVLNTEQEEHWFTSEKVIVMPQGDEEKVLNTEQEEHWFTSEKVIVMPQGDEEKVLNTGEEEFGFMAEKVIVMSQKDEEKLLNTGEDLDDEDDAWLYVETEDDENVDIDITLDVQDSSIPQDGKEDDSSVDVEAEVVEHSESMDDAIVVDNNQLDDVTEAKVKELQDQLIMAQNRADMWLGKYVEDHHHKPEVVVVEKMEAIDLTQDVESDREVDKLQEQLNVANARADRWQRLYREKAQTSNKHQFVKQENFDEEETIKDSTSSDDQKRKQKSDTCGPLGCFTVFENILTNFLNSTEGQEFLRFANLTQVLNNATFWEDFATATNISAYMLSDAVYQSWMEFQDYVKTAQSSYFISNFSAVLARAGQSVVSAFSSVKNYSSTVGDKAQNAWDSVRNYTSDTIDQHNIHLNNISQLKEKVAAAWDTVRNMSSKVVNNDTKKKLSDVVDQAQENLKVVGQTVYDNMKDLGKTVHDNMNDFGKSVQDNMQDLGKNVKGHGKTVKDNMKDFGKTVQDNVKDLRNNMKDLGKTVKDNMKDVGKTVQDNMKDLGNNMKDLGKTVKDNMKDFGKTVQGNMKDLGNNMKDLGKTVKDNMKDFGKTVQGNMKDLGNNMKDLGKTVKDNMKDVGKTVHDTWTSVKDTMGKWRRDKKQHNKHKEGRGKHDEWNQHDSFDKTDDDKDLTHEQWVGKKTGKKDKGEKHYGSGKCKGKKCDDNKDNEDQTFGPRNKGEKKNGCHKKRHHDRDEKRGHRQGHHHETSKPTLHQKKQDKKFGESNAAFWNVDWDDVLDVFNMNCYGESDCLNHQRSDAAKLYEELTEYKKWLKSQNRKSELKEVRKFLETLGEFLSDPDLDDNDLEDLKEEFEEVLEKVGRFVQDQRDRTNEESEFNSTVILDFDQLKTQNDDKDKDESSQSKPERRKFAGFGYHSDEDDDNWFLRRAKDREDHYQDRWSDDDEEGGDGSWYLTWMQGRTNSRTGVTMWDMYRWITDRFDHKENLRQYDEINWFLKRP